MGFKTYPLTFTPILKEKIWGGHKLKSILNKPIVSDITGESWEISTIENYVSVVNKGFYTKESLANLINTYPEEILGTSVYRRFGKQFPLLFKYIDATEDLSIQVHPNDELAGKRHQSFGKTEMWYIVQADADARLIIGFKENSNADKYLQNLADKTLPSILNVETVSKGDAFFLETGTIHAIGAGVVLAEIQQTSDITYRIYDWDRKDKYGNSRELHVDLALEAINYKKITARKKYKDIENKSEEIVSCPFFTTNHLSLNGTFSNIQNDRDSFIVYMCIAGSFCIIHDSVSYYYETGHTVLLPANLKRYTLQGTATLLEIFIS